MIDHITWQVADLKKSKALYAAALKPLGYEIVMDGDDGVGLGVGGKPDLFLAPGKHPSMHIAFRAKTRAAVDAFHAAALKAGAKDNGAPGVRTDYSPTYYAAFVHDFDGHNLEAVCHEA